METGACVAVVAPSVDAIGGSCECFHLSVQDFSSLEASQLGFEGGHLSASRFELVSPPLRLISIPFLYFQVPLFAVVVQMYGCFEFFASQGVAVLVSFFVSIFIFATFFSVGRETLIRRGTLCFTEPRSCCTIR